MRRQSATRCLSAWTVAFPALRTPSRLLLAGLQRSPVLLFVLVLILVLVLVVDTHVLVLVDACLVFVRSLVGGAEHYLEALQTPIQLRAVSTACIIWLLRREAL